MTNLEYLKYCDERIALGDTDFKLLKREAINGIVGMRREAVTTARNVLRATEDYQAAVYAVLNEHLSLMLTYPEDSRMERAEGIVRFAENQLGWWR